MKKCVWGIFPVVMLVTMCAGGAKPAESSTASSGGMLTLDQALKEAAARIDERVAAKTKIAPLNFNSPHDKFSGYVLDEVTANLVDSGKLTVVDRKEVDLIRGEFDFQFSGEVGDDSIQQLGRMLGAQSIISGSLTDLGGFYRIVIRVLNVQNASVEVQYRANIANDNVMAALLTGGKTAAVASAPRQTPSGGNSSATPAPVAIPVQSTPAPPVPVPAPAPVPAAPTTYEIGDTGPAGGTIFYINPTKGTWKYLEAAPASTEKVTFWTSEWFSIDPIRDVRAIDKGKSNTGFIMRAAIDLGGGFDWAAEICDSLTVNGYSDWFLPSRDELNQMWGNLHRKGLGGFKAEWYWSSTPTIYSWNWTDYRGAWRQNFANGEQSDGRRYGDNYGDKLRVRAIRQF